MRCRHPMGWPTLCGHFVGNLHPLADCGHPMDCGHTVANGCPMVNGHPRWNAASPCSVATPRGGHPAH